MKRALRRLDIYDRKKSSLARRPFGALVLRYRVGKPSIWSCFVNSYWHMDPKLAAKT